KVITYQQAFGYETKFNREELGLPKAHFVDAICVGMEKEKIYQEQRIELPQYILKKVSIAKGDYQQTESQPNKKGIRPKLSRGKVMGFKKFDRVKYFNTTAFIKGKMATGYGILMDIDGKKLDFGHIPKFKMMRRIGARKTCLIDHLRIENFTSNTILYSSANIEKTSLKERLGKR
ncbi:MAG: hypothetical protein HQK53_15470, partial [Oligoflexia bacterium]|nr:hypothetical protein [Oligoflexia bacterium]